ncbi:Siroheme synthase [uncultured Clostridium sp.]|uniref:uroporphyrinogen-III C-methyltransferase n=1 Tax=uncultured Clostridium sp. TaxID=59620 RepID=UPI0008225AE3|nr:uroporphyrinogen-III C-methyltransferase [uncultured Clostridium sp.]SCI91327.1 Siroheme synthase [uncultured Clostridium sp.]
MKTGKVYLVGAGPSDEGLFTLKGKHLLETADVVVYDQLVGNGIMRMISKDAECIDVGKHAGNHKVGQERINEILLEEAQKGKRVVRLKGGDPFLFGRGGEELELLCEHNIPFEIVPGITSAISVPAYAGIPVTHRDFTSSLHIITGHKKRGCNEPVDYKGLVGLGEVTLVFLMSVGALPEISKGLIEAGMDKNTPAAILEKGTRYNQRKVVATIETLPEEAKKNNIGTPGIIIVGKVCSLSEQFAWVEKRELAGRRVIITRPKNKTSKLKEKLYDLGAEVVEFPSILTKPIENNETLDLVINNIEKYNWIAFASEVAVEVFFDNLMNKKIDIRKLSGIKLAVVGPATKIAIEKRGLFIEFMPEKYFGKNLAKGLIKSLSYDDKVLAFVPRDIDSELVKYLKPCKNEIDIVPLYDIKYEKNRDVMVDKDDLVVFTSASTVRGFVNSIGNIEFDNINAICIGNKTAEEAKSYGMNIVISMDATIDSLVECVIECNKRGFSKWN